MQPSELMSDENETASDPNLKIKIRLSGIAENSNICSKPVKSEQQSFPEIVEPKFASLESQQSLALGLMPERKRLRAGENMASSFYEPLAQDYVLRKNFFSEDKGEKYTCFICEEQQNLQHLRDTISHSVKSAFKKSHQSWPWYAREGFKGCLFTVDGCSVCGVKIEERKHCEILQTMQKADAKSFADFNWCYDNLREEYFISSGKYEGYKVRKCAKIATRVYGKECDIRIFIQDSNNRLYIAKDAYFAITQKLAEPCTYEKTSLRYRSEKTISVISKPRAPEPWTSASPAQMAAINEPQPQSQFQPQPQVSLLGVQYVASSPYLFVGGLFFFPRGTNIIPLVNETVQTASQESLKSAASSPQRKVP